MLTDRIERQIYKDLSKVVDVSTMRKKAFLNQSFAIFQREKFLAVATKMKEHSNAEDEDCEGDDWRRWLGAISNQQDRSNPISTGSKNDVRHEDHHRVKWLIPCFVREVQLLQ